MITNPAIKLFVIAGFAVSMLTACKSAKIDRTNPDNNGQVLLQMDRTGCFGQCPTYQVRLYENGLLLYDGIRYVEQTGKYFGILDKKQLSEWKEKLEKLNLFELKDRYPYEYEAPADLPGVIITYHQNGQTKRIVDRGDKTPVKLMILEVQIDSLVKSKNLHSFDK